MANTLEAARAAHARACAAYDAARFADWHPNKAQDVAQAYAKCCEAARIMNRIWIVEHAPEYAAAHNITR